ncbi:ATP-binding cassette domain-containing protein, partial [Candidatus Dojkabacteria bacterium]|nr:ATP-binding cassette domain-containing protein [Candidatus Dojkabacteria bacterium]
MKKELVVKVKNLSKEFKVSQKSIKAINNISFNIYKEEFVGFIGQNGAGKTTTLKCLTGLLAPDEGEVRVLGHEPQKRDYDFLSSISLVMGNKSQLWWELPPIETFLLNKEIYQIEDTFFKKNLSEMVERLGITESINIPVRKLSLGERMKCELVASFLHSPELLFLDEPTLGLDIVSQQKLRDFLADYQARNKATVILTSHNMEDIKNLCKRVIIIDKGKLLYDGRLTELTEKFVKEKFVRFV